MEGRENAYVLMVSSALNSCINLCMSRIFSTFYICLFVCLFNEKCLRIARKELYLISSFPCRPDILMNDLMSSYGRSEKWLILSSVYKGSWSSEKWSNLPEISHTLKWRIINLNTLACKTVVISTMPCYLLTWISLSKCWLFCSLFFSFLHTDPMQRYHIPISHCSST